ncbi:MAG: hypothetical protein COA78_13535 [Blastopirellula sp.]|nr:MAG: hypothetical protein COA78_13535 [Blastopirellula sp.]
MNYLSKISLTSFIAILTCCQFASAEEPLDFNRDIRPILSANCFFCHGPDEETQEADLRLDTEDGLFADLGGYAPIVAGHPKKSEAFRRITSDDEDERMPPIDSNKELTTDQILLLKKWIEQGAKWNSHWSFDSPVKSTPPKVKQKKWARTDIDRYLLARMEQAGLKPSVEADTYTLIRRLYLDLNGIPPSVEEADAWAARLSEGTKAAKEKAYEELVDHLLAQPAYGERWARRWLDLARYADTNGYEKDRHRDIWRYRDWVINALNDDMPYTQFTVEQLAGDMLPNSTLDQKIATGFHRNTMLNEEGGIDPLEFRFYAMTDRVSTTGTTWLGLTTGCAQCHTHKFDPITHDEYYGMMAFLNNANEPELPIPDESVVARRAANLKKAEKLIAQLPEQWPVDEESDVPPEKQRETAIEEAYQKWLDESRLHSVEWKTMRPSLATSTLPLLTIEDDDAVFASGDTAKIDIYTLEYDLAGKTVNSILLETLPDERLPRGGPGSTYYEGTLGDFFLGEIRLFVDGEPVEIASATESYTKNRYGKNSTSAELAFDGDPQTGWSVHDRQGERHTAAFVLKEPITSGKKLKIKMAFGRHYASSLGRFRFSSNSSEKEPIAYDLSPEVQHLLTLSDDQLEANDHPQLKAAFLLQAKELTKQTADIRKLLKPIALPTSLVMQERPANNRRPTHLHHRGEYLSAKHLVEPQTISALHSFPEGAERNRLGFAQWIASPQNPLFARVAVNRHWAALFGRGLVGTLDDFGMQGDMPSHPQLLDHLAVSYAQNNWSTKHLHKQMVMSSVYRQTTNVDAGQVERDPGNQLLSRMPRFRLEAEIIRDAALKSSGILSAKMGGPPVRPPQPAGVTEAAYGKQKWNANSGEDRYRRSVYTYQKRTAPFAMFNTFDAPSGESCVATRDVSNTALQALTMLNDVMFLEAAQALGKKVATTELTAPERATAIFRDVLTRSPSEAEIKQILTFVDQQQTRFSADIEKAKQVSGVKEDATAVDVAVWTTVARALFNLDETVTRN